MKKRLLDLLLDLTFRKRWLIWTVAIVLTVLMGWASSLITLDVRWSTLLPESDPDVKEFKKIDNTFLQPGNMIIAISGPDEAKLEHITDEVTLLMEKELKALPDSTLEEIKAQERYARHVYGRTPNEWITQHILWLLKPKDAERFSLLLRDPRMLPYLEHLNDDFEREYTDSENIRVKEREIVGSLDAVQRFADILADAGTEPLESNRIFRTVRDLTIGRPYMFSLDNTMSLILIASAIPSDDMETIPKVDRKVEELLRPIQKKYPDYQFERTGLLSIYRDEMDSVGPQTQLITLLAFVLIFLLLIWSFRSAMLPLLMLIPIVVGIIWASGVVGLVLGSMNLMTVMFMVIILGLGIDFSIHIASRFYEELNLGQDVEQALRLAVSETGAGVITGAVTSAIAFLTLMCAQNRGIYEFGFCAGMGVIVTLISVFWLLPALMVTSVERRIKKHDGLPKISEFSFLNTLTRFVEKRRIAVFVGMIILTILGGFAGSRVDWEWNIMNLEPKGLRSISLQDEIIEKFKISPTISMFVADSPEESRQIRETLQKKRVVGDVDDVSLWVSRPDVEENIPFIDALRNEASQSRESIDYSLAENREKLLEELDRLWANLVEIQALSITGGQDRIVEKTRQLVSVRKTRDAGRLFRLVEQYKDFGNINWTAVAGMDQMFRKDLEMRIDQMLQHEGAVTFESVPEPIRDRYANPDEAGYLVQIYPKKNLYGFDDMVQFQDSISRTYPHVTGTPQMVYKMNMDMLKEGKFAFLLAAAVIFMVLIFDFRGLLRGSIPMIGLLGGVGMLLGFLWIMGMKLNYISVIGLPVIIGIGVDDGVHLLHRTLKEGRQGLPRAVKSVGKAVILTSATTMIGFGSLMVYMMRGMASLGVVLFFGVGFCLFTTFTLLPAMISLFPKGIFKRTDNVKEES